MGGARAETSADVRTRQRPDFIAATELASTAPSVHNTQPWHFRVDGETLTLLRDQSRQLANLDPQLRQMTISCGAALYLARLALRRQGFDTRVETHEPTAGDNESMALLATIHVEPGSAPSSDEVQLVEQARSRHMNRGLFEPRPLEDAALATMRAAVEEQGAWLVLREPSEQVGLAVLLARADAIERNDPAYLEELAAWTTNAAPNDGVKPHARAGDVSSRASTLRLRDFGAAEEAAPAQRPDDDDPPAAEHPLVAVIGTEGDTVTHWLVAGQALCALLVRGGVYGIAASPLGQVIDLVSIRTQLKHELGVLGFPQMVLRLGYAPQGPKTPRRSLAHVLYS